MPRDKDETLASSGLPDPCTRPVPADGQETDELAAGLGLIEYDVYVRMPPKRRYTVQVKIRCVRKARPHIVEPWWARE